MYRFVLLVSLSILMLRGQLSGQSTFSDDFSDGDFSSNPTWIGQSTEFIVNSSNQLQLNNASPGSSNFSSLVTTSTAINSATWEFYIRLDFAPSSSNFARVYLVSDQQDLTQSLNGYFVQIGGQSGTVDDVSLFRQDASTTVELIDGVDGTVASSPEVRVRVTRNANQQWELWLDQTATGSNYLSQGTANDTSYNTSNYFGVFCRYTSTRSDKFFFDDFNVIGGVIRDTLPPRVNNISVVSNTSLTIAFNEHLDPSSALSTNNYTVNNNIGNPNSAQFLNFDSSVVQLTFSNPFVNGETYDLVAKNIADTAGNILSGDTSSFTYFIPVPAQYRDIVVNEIYPDFTPSNGLPEAEFVELFNASNEVFDLNGWTFSDGSSSAFLPAYIMKSGEFVILCSLSDTALFSPFGKTLGVPSFPGLNNAGDHLQFFDPMGLLIDEVNYTDDWYQDVNKENGGYTLEQINPFNPCSGMLNFTASNQMIGGSPGTINSVFDANFNDTMSPLLLNVSIISQDSVSLRFNELLDTSSIIAPNFILTPNIQVNEAIAIAPDFNSVILTLSNPLDSGIIYSISVLDVTDCSGNSISDDNQSFIALPSMANSNDIVINEILFNPRTDGVDFVELFNRTDKVIDLSSLRIADEANIPQLITEESFLLLPKSFTVITESKENILQEYPLGVESRIIEVDNLPGFDNEEDTVYLSNETGLSIDVVTYNEDQHFTLLQDVNGVSLERISVERPSNDPTNFHSASETVGFATPGYENSQAFENIRFSGDINLEPDIFSPDNDGFQDILHINYQFSSPGFVASINIFDRNGRLIKRLVQNELLGSSGTFSWDGITDDNLKARIGIYVLLIEAFDVNGNQEVYKEVITVAGDLD